MEPAKDNPLQFNIHSIKLLNIVAGVCAIFLLTGCLMFYKGSSSASTTDVPDLNEEPLEIENKSEIIIPRPKRIVMQPSTHISYMYVILDDIIQDIEINRVKCRPEDIYNLAKHRIPRARVVNKKRDEERGNLVVYIAVGLLLVWVGSAAIDILKEKGALGPKSKPQLVKRCSLADLTVLRHARKENMRRESMFVGEADNRAASRNLGERLNLRRSSVPIMSMNTQYPYGRHGVRRLSANPTINNNNPTENKHLRLIRIH